MRSAAALGIGAILIVGAHAAPKRDLRGFWPGMAQADVASAIEAGGFRCREKIEYTACTASGSDDEIDLTWARELKPALVAQVDLYLRSGLSGEAMADRVSAQFGTAPGHRIAAKDDGNVPAMSALGMRIAVATWDLGDGATLELSGAESFRLRLFEPAIGRRNEAALRARLAAEKAKLNPTPKF